MTRKKRSIVVGLIGVIGGILLGLGAGYQLWAGAEGDTQRIPIEGSEKKAMIKKDPSGNLRVWLPARHLTQVRMAGQKVGAYDQTQGLVNIYRKGEQKKIVTDVRVWVPGNQFVLAAKFYPENGAVKHIRVSKPDGDRIGAAKFRNNGTVKSLERFESNRNSTSWKFDREGNIIDRVNSTYSWD